MDVLELDIDKNGRGKIIINGVTLSEVTKLEISAGVGELNKVRIELMSAVRGTVKVAELTSAEAVTDGN